MAVYRLQFQVQSYEWGSVHGISNLLGIANPEKKKIAELWLGDHHRGPSLIELPDGVMPLDQFLAERPEHLGDDSRAAFGDHLPFLLKVLSAAKPLSIQVHPDRKQASVGFQREENEQIEMNAGNRGYPDDNHKPELLYALTPFRALCGLRPVKEIADSLKPLKSTQVKRLLKALSSSSEKLPLKVFFSALQNMDEEEQQLLVDECLSSLTQDARIWNEIRRLNNLFPGDIGVLSPLFLNLIQLKPGEAMFLPPGTLHTYLEGAGLEVMACSDNVVRGGLTEKHRDIEELLKVVDWSDHNTSAGRLLSRAMESEEQVFKAPATEFCFAVMTLFGSTKTHKATAAEIILCLEGKVKVTDECSASVQLTKGQACFVSAVSGQCSISGSGRAARVSSNVEEAD